MSEVSDLVEQWKETFGDPNDPAVRAEIEKTADGLKAWAATGRQLRADHEELLAGQPDSFPTIQFRTNQAVHHGVLVHQHPTMDALRRDQCLCLNCGLLGSCSIAKKLLEACIQHNVALSVTRCPIYQPKAVLAN